MKKPSISQELEKIRVYQIDQLIKRIQEEVGVGEEWRSLLEIKDSMGLLYVNLRNLGF